VLANGGELPGNITAPVGRHPFAVMIEFDDLVVVSGLNDLSSQLERNGIIMLRDFRVIIDVGTAILELRVNVTL
jgi:hypothetical protein